MPHEMASDKRRMNFCFWCVDLFYDLVFQMACPHTASHNGFKSSSSKATQCHPPHFSTAVYTYLTPPLKNRIGSTLMAPGLRPDAFRKV